MHIPADSNFDLLIYGKRTVQFLNLQYQPASYRLLTFGEGFLVKSIVLGSDGAVLSAASKQAALGKYQVSVSRHPAKLATDELTYQVSLTSKTDLNFDPFVKLGSIQ